MTPSPTAEALRQWPGSEADRALRARGSFRSWFYGLTFAYPFAWVIGLAGFYWVVLSLGAAAYLARARLRPLTWAVLAVPLTLLLSAPIGMVATSAGPSRLVGLAANLTVWVSTAAIIQLVESGDERRFLSRAVTWVGLWQGAITLIAVIASPQALPIPLLRGLAPRLPSGIGAFMQNGLYFPSWLDGMAYRSSGIMAQPTWAGAVAVVALVSALYLLIVERERGAWRWLAVAAVPLSLVSINLSLSRAASLGILIALVAGGAAVMRRRPGPLFPAFVVVATLMGLVVALTAWAPIMEWIGSVNAQRVGSWDARSEIYGATWDLIRAHPFPLLGYGVKPEEAALVASVATHSAYLGMAFRGGLFGLAALVVIFAGVVRRGVRAGSFWTTFAGVFIAVWCVMEDLDPGHLVPLVLPLALAWSRPAPDGGPASEAQPAPDGEEGSTPSAVEAREAARLRSPSRQGSPG